MGPEGIEPSNDGLEPSSLPLAYGPPNYEKQDNILSFTTCNLYRKDMKF